MMTYTPQEICVLPMRSRVDLKELEVQLRLLYRTEASARCHALQIASYISFRNHCLRVFDKHSDGRADASLPDGYRLQYVDENVIVTRMTFQVQEVAGTAEDDMDI